MICPICGFEQPGGENCSQCQTRLTPAFKEAPSAEPKQTAIHPVSDKAVAEPLVAKKPDVPSKAETSNPPSEPPQKVEEKVPPPAPEKPAQEKNEPAPGGVHERLEQLERLIVTSTPQIEGRQILAYHGIVSATVLIKVDLIKERFQSVTGEVVSIRSSSLEGPFEKARTVGLTDLKVEAAKRGANAVVGFTLSQTPCADGIWLCLAGTAVTLKE